MPPAARRHAFTKPTPGVPEPYRQDVERALQARVTREEELETEIDAVEESTPAAYTDEQVRDVIGAALVAGTNITITVNDGADTITIDGTAAGAPTNAQYVTLATNASLSAERVLTAGHGIDLADAGANSTITIDVDETELDIQAPQYVTLAATAALPNERVLTPGHGLDMVDAGAGSTVTLDVDETELDLQAAQYVTLANTSSLPNERALTAGVGIDLTDGGAGSTITVDVDISEISRWETLREIDFNAWADTDFATGGDGTYALNDGTGSINWIVDASANANQAGGSTANAGFFRKNAADVGSDGASGLRISHDTGTSTNMSSSTLTGGGSGPPRIAALLTDLVTGFTPFDEYRFEIHITRLTDRGTSPANAGIHIGIGSVANAPTGSAARYGGAAMVRNGANEGGPSAVSSANTELKITDAAYAFTAGNVVISCQAGPDSYVKAHCGTYSGGWGADSAFRCAGQALASGSTLSTTTVASILATSSTGVVGTSGPYVIIAADSRSSVAGCVDFMVRRMRILRRVR